MNNPNCILAAIDFSARSRVALGFAARLACRFNAELRVMHAQDPLLSTAAEARSIDPQGETEDELRAFVAEVPAQAIVTRGRAASCLAETAERYPHAIVAVGRFVHPHGSAPPGKTAYRLLVEARVPVLMHVAP